ncbi:hypothetical protein [Paenisporosarcina cavernae]|uniref:Uncharacterized protein n=1 Tax=Paenisporosarcina cavernae TaxID=2320858 RepID=A0A385YVI4_9BACL|nr:hypothetical protein [Paenisporosarcina cavernae]AYC29907.1 hypothetical protein D3873_08370 [Paenisporosarcina cavernae]
METFVSLIIVAAGIALFVLMKKTKKNYVINFGIAVFLLLLFVRTLMLDPLDWIGYVALLFCAIGAIAQVVLGIKNKAIQS